MEIFKDVKNYEGIYQVSNYGNIKSLLRYKTNHSKLQLIPEKIKRTRLKSNGYVITDLYKNNKSKTVYVHRIVALAFIENNDPLKTQINHIDGNKENNHISNLEWSTPSENIIHAFRNNLMKSSQCRVGKNSKSGFANINPKKGNKTFTWIGSLRTKEKRYYKSSSNIYEVIVWYNALLRNLSLSDNLIEIKREDILKYGNGLCCLIY